MEPKQTNEPILERTIVRRGLLAGLASLGGAVLMHVKGTSKAEAAPAFELNVTTNVATAETRLTALPSLPAAPVLQVSNGGNWVNVGGAITAIVSSSQNPGIMGQQQNGGSGVFGSVVGGSQPPGFGAAGVRGQAIDNGQFGVWGHVQAPAVGVGVDGLSQAAGGIGVRGRGHVNGVGVYGLSSAGFTENGDGSAIGVHGKSGSGIGVKGDSTSAPGVEGTSVSSLGVRGSSTHFVGVVGISTNNHGLYGYSGSASGTALVGDNGGGGLAGVFNGRVEVYGSFQVFGVKNAVLQMPDGTNALVYCQESPEPYFEDFGKAQLLGGVASIAIERDFATLVGGGEYLVFLTPEGDTRGLFVSRKGPAGFEVREVQAGTSNVPFTYRIVTKRKDVESKRFARVSDDGIKSVAAARASLGIADRSSPPSFVPPTSGTVPAPPTNPIVPNPAPPGPRLPQDGFR